MFWKKKKRDPPEVIAKRKADYQAKKEEEAREMAEKALKEKLKLAKEISNQLTGGAANSEALILLALTIEDSTNRIVKELDRIGDRCGRYPSGHCGPL